MKNGFLKVAAASLSLKVADTEYNSEEIIKNAIAAGKMGAKIIVFPELCISGYTCNDLFLQELLLKKSMDSLFDIAKKTTSIDALIFLGLPFNYKGKLYNVAAAIKDGKILGLVPKRFFPNYSEYYELRHFTKGDKKVTMVKLSEDVEVPFGSNIMFECRSMPELRVAAEICEDVWVADSPGISHALNGANVIVNTSASDETVGKDTYRRQLISSQSARLICAYIYANAGEGESTQDLVFGGQNIICENGIVLSEAERFKNKIIYADIDIERLVHERRRMNSFELRDDDYVRVDFDLKNEETKLERFVDPKPFVPGDVKERSKRCEEILNIQSMGLKKRIVHTGCKCPVVGISGGLDSTLALIVTVRAMDMAGLDRSNILSVTMPCFGTTNRTYNNAVALTKKLGATLKEVNIKDAVNIHFRDIGHDDSIHDVTYENGQARERTQILMDLANKNNGMVIGTGDMSELALGWATYNGDHMSMYGVNVSIPKTLVRHLVRYYADTCNDKELADILYDVLDTPVSPELLPPKEGEIAQKTEDLVGPYELHDFFLYYVLRFGFSPKKIYRLARIAFEEKYDASVIFKWLKTFYSRFFAQQFKRSCLPDGPKVGSVAVSPRGDLRMPSDASKNIWMKELEEIK
ncbi:NAD+ synthase (glutamine-hydrolysing) [Acetitomaculum ruminis DSM 5522]|uniref:Glutamine-dependent NAD(+) synthetase n=1 Tax=Acetitomaculum ruminis DSM 5522 TaxID=1120918 RepID=A0A1I0XM45_9FIRM|nr:NAD(+) synthase [Acetitomaculum ruminis]SFB02189.1 NAD+ synthase (glutamine-hydrolysing) [Acetitomaculum ruminis DSM 5522]